LGENVRKPLGFFDSCCRCIYDGYVAARLRDLLDSEKCQYASESVTTQETALERQSRLRERARQLREKREAERLAFVEEKYEQQFRSECFVYFLVP